MKKNLLILCLLLLFMGCQEDELSIEEPPAPLGPIYNEEILSGLGASGWYPYVLTTTEGEIPKGAGFDVLREVLGELGLQLDVRPMTPWPRLLEAVKRQHIDFIVGIYYTEERSQDYVYSIPFYEDRVSLVTKKDGPIRFESLEDLDGYVGLMPEGANYGMELAQYTKNADIRRVKGKEEALDLLLEEAADYFISAEMDLIAYLNKEGLREKFLFHQQPIVHHPVYFATSKDNPAAMLMPMINQQLQLMKDQGRIEEIIQTYLKEVSY